MGDLFDYLKEDKMKHDNEHSGECRTSSAGGSVSGLKSLGNIASVGTGPRVRCLPSSVHKEVTLMNRARELAGLSPIIVKIRRCISCGTLFESVGHRTCGCVPMTSGVMAGREII